MPLNIPRCNLRWYRILFCTRELTSTTRWENGRPVRYPEIIVDFQPLMFDQTKPWKVSAESPEEALSIAKNLVFPASPINLLLAVEPVPQN